jgi:hypothetical protein
MAMAKTDAGQKVLKDRRSGLTPRQRAALIMIDGQRSVDDLLAATSAGGITRADIDHLVQLGLVSEQPAQQGQPQAQAQASVRAQADPQPARQRPIRTHSEEDFTDSSSLGWGRYVRAYGIATELSAELARKDVELSLAIDAAGTIEELESLAPRIRAAVGPVKFARLEAALKAR